MSEVQLAIANTGTRNVVNKIEEPIVIASGTAANRTTLAVVFERAFIVAPSILEVGCVNSVGSETIKFYITDITTTGFNLRAYNTVTTVTATYDVTVIVQGQQAFA